MSADATPAAPHSAGPARGYSWPPFEKNNTVAMRHGAHSERVVAAKCEEISPGFDAWIAERAPWATAGEFGPMRLNYLRSLAVVELLAADILETAATAGSGAVPTRRFETMLSALRSEREALGQLGLTPPTKAQLAATVTSAEIGQVDLVQRAAAAAKAASTSPTAARPVLDAEEIPDDEDEPS